ncbi:MAG: DUF4469 domain-containing protein [Tannerella sp.]|jgi:hypothetical protein|nr:DUF4469 domain-containing protein [Tannerella sp.]
MKKYYWKTWLRPNYLTKATNDYVAEVATTGRTLHNQDIARQYVEMGSELQYETVLDVLNRADRLRREKLQEGYCVQTGVCHHAPQIVGSWIGATASHDPELHRLTLSSVPTAEMRTALGEVGVEVLGIREGGAYISLVTDVTTGLTDGTLTPGGQIIIAGDRIKIEPVKGEAGIGVFLTDGVSDDYPVTPLAINHPKEIIALVPANLPTGTYTLFAVTRYSNGDRLLKDPRRITYTTPLIVT